MQKIKGYFAAFTIALGLGFIILCMFFIKKDSGRAARRHCSWFFLANNCKYTKIGEYDPSATLIIANHQSAIDIICLESNHPRNLCWVGKEQLGKIPFYGYAMTLPNMILINRDDKRGIIQLIKEAKDRLEQNRPIVIFPEGTRGPGTREFLPFKPGAKILAEKLNLKVQPIVFINTRKVFDSNPVQSLGDEVRVICLPAFTPDPNTNWYEQVEKDMFATYCKHYDELNPNQTESNKNNL